MKWSVVILLVVGVFAALAAAVLVAALRADTLRQAAGLGSPASAQVTVVVAKRSLAPRTLVTADAVETRTVARSAAPDADENALADASQAVGKVLAMPVPAGQRLTKAMFAGEGTDVQQGVRLASQLTPGTRAVAVTVSDAGGLHGILYPGCAVDVLVAIKRTAAGDEAPQTISTTLLENVPVLAVDQQTVVTPQSTKKNEGDNGVIMRPRDLKVTLRVDVQQAKALQLGQDVGTLSLALRNPEDQARNPETGPVSLRILAGGTAPGGTWAGAPELVPAALTSGAPEPREKPVAAVAAPVRMEQWETTIIRGETVETHLFPMPSAPRYEASNKN